MALKFEFGSHLKGALKTRTVVHRKRVGESEVPELMRRTETYEGDIRTRLAKPTAESTYQEQEGISIIIRGFILPRYPKKSVS